MTQGVFEFDDETVADSTYSVSELNATIGAVVRRAFGDEVWVRGEVKGYKVSPAGHAYFSMVERTDDGEQVLNVSLFKRARVTVTDYLARHRMRLADGIEIRVCGQVEFYAGRGQISMRMTGIDPTYTLGKLAGDRDALLRSLAAQGLLDRNKARSLALAPRRVGVVTSAGSAAHHDFHHELALSGFGFLIVLCDSRVQGPDAHFNVAAAIATLSRRELDVICVVRGGGSRTDLATFDTEVIALAIARCRVPVICGVGHEIDSSVADLVAHTALKTPTACAQFLVERVRAYVNEMESRWGAIASRADEILGAADQRTIDTAARVQREVLMAVRHGEDRFQRDGARVVTAARRGADRADGRVARALDRMRRRAPRLIVEHERRLDSLEPRIANLDPARLLSRGWSITHRADGTLVKGPSDAPVDTELVTTTAGGRISSRVERS